MRTFASVLGLLLLASTLVLPVTAKAGQTPRGQSVLLAQELRGGEIPEDAGEEEAPAGRNCGFLPGQPRCLTVDIGTRATFNTLAIGIMRFLAITITSVCFVLFTIGAFMFVASRGKDEEITKGKELMFGAVTGMVVVLSAAAIARTVYYFIFIQ